MNRARTLLATTIGLWAVALGVGTCSLAPDLGRDPAEQFALKGLGFELFLALAACAGAALSSQSLGARLGLAPSRLSRPQLLVLVAGTLALSAALDGLLHTTGLHEGSALEDFETRFAGVRGRALLLAVLGFALAPGVAEELLCRGLIQRGLAVRLGPVAAIFAAGAIFGALHVELVHAVFASFLGFYLGAVAEIARSVRPAIACHVLNNLAAVAASAGDLGGGPQSWAGIGACLAAALLALFWVARRVSGDYSREPNRTTY
jgi:membrane protease YdiL (CAAX protease family)